MRYLVQRPRSIGWTDEGTSSLLVEAFDLRCNVEEALGPEEEAGAGAHRAPNQSQMSG
jgi:hypothetical protein